MNCHIYSIDNILNICQQSKIVEFRVGLVQKSSNLFGPDRYPEFYQLSHLI